MTARFSAASVAGRSSLMETETRSELRLRYFALRETYFGLVGTLYPGIAYAELMSLRERYVGGPGWGDLPPVWPPNENGQAPRR